MRSIRTWGNRGIPVVSDLVRQNDDSTFVITNLPKSLPIGTAIHPSLTGQPPKPVCTTSHDRTPCHILAASRGSFSNASTWFLGLGKSMYLMRSKGNLSIDMSNSFGSRNSQGQPSVRLDIYSRWSARSFAQSSLHQRLPFAS